MYGGRDTLRLAPMSRSRPPPSSNALRPARRRGGHLDRSRHRPQDAPEPRLGDRLQLARLPIAAGVFEPWGLTLRPEVAAIPMSGSSIIVAVNALALKRLWLPWGQAERAK